MMGWGHERQAWVPPAPSTICSEENAARVAALRERQARQERQERQGPEPGTTRDDYLDDIVNRVFERYNVPLNERRVSAPASTFVRTLIRVEETVRSTSTSIGVARSLRPRPVMTGENIIRYPLNPNPSGSPPSVTVQSPSRFEPEAAASFPSGSNSIRVVTPDFALSPSQKPGTGPAEVEQKATTMHPYQQQGLYGGEKAGESSRPRFNAAQQPTDTRSRVERLRQQLFDVPGPGGPRPARIPASQVPSSHVASGPSGNVGGPSTERGRDMRRRYEFIDSDDNYDMPQQGHHPVQPVQPVQEPTGQSDKGKGKGKAIDTNVGRDNDMTTVTGLMQQCAEQQTPRDQAIHDQSQSREKRRPQPLDLQDPNFLGMVNRHTQRYRVEHNPVQSSRAEVFQATPPPATPYESSSVYSQEGEGVEGVEDVDDVEAVDDSEVGEAGETGETGGYVISRLEHKTTTKHSVNFLEAFSEWRDGLNPRRTASQGSIHIRVPNAEEDTFMADRERALRQLEGEIDDDNNANADDGNEAVTSPVLTRSATMRHVPGHGHGNSHGREAKVASDRVEAQGENVNVGQQGIRKSATMNDVPARRSSLRLEVPPSPFTPLTPFIMRASGAPANAQGGTKTLFGEKGWLEDTAGTKQKKPKPEKTASGFMESLRRMARELTDNSSFNSARHYRSSSATRLTISLDPREQSLLYGELEFGLNNALDAYIKTQLNSGRLDPTKLSRVAEGWLQLGRPKVVSFRYDVETQIDLVAIHVNDFRFYGPLPAQGHPAVLGLLQCMRTNARYMRVRTYCQPDTVIAKQILDSQNLLRLLGSPEFLQRPLEEVAQFFKVAIDRRRIMDATPPPRDARRAGPSVAQQQQAQGHEQDGQTRARNLYNAKPRNVSGDQKKSQNDDGHARGQGRGNAPAQGRHGHRQ